MLIRITAAVLTCCAVMSCVDDSAVVEELDWAEAVMEAHPDSALALLDTLDRSRLRTRGAKARHALLYSQALDHHTARCAILRQARQPQRPAQGTVLPRLHLPQRK